MKKSVINQVEKTLHYECSCWDDITIEREDTKAWTMFIITEDGETIYNAPLKTAIEVVDSYNLISSSKDACLTIEIRTSEDGIVKPVIKILIKK